MSRDKESASEDQRASDKATNAAAPSARPSQLHDGFAKQVFGSPAEAKAELMAVLPAAVSRRIVWSTLRQEPVSTVDRALRQSHSDLVFSAKLRVDEGNSGERDALLLHVMEHQSTPDHAMAARLWVYAASAVAKWLQKNRSAKRIPLVFVSTLYNGTRRWNAPLSLGQLYGLPPAVQAQLAPYLPELRYTVDDLGNIPDAQLRDRAGASAMAKLGWLLLSHELVQGLERPRAAGLHLDGQNRRTLLKEVIHLAMPTLIALPVVQLGHLLRGLQGAQSLSNRMLG